MFRRPLRDVLELSHLTYLSSQANILGFNQLTSLGAGIEIDTDTVTKLFVARYAFGRDITGASLGLALSFRSTVQSSTIGTSVNEPSAAAAISIQKARFRCGTSAKGAMFIVSGELQLGFGGHVLASPMCVGFGVVVCDMRDGMIEEPVKRTIGAVWVTPVRAARIDPPVCSDCADPRALAAWRT